MDGTRTIMFYTGAATHVGMVRSRNEDSYLVRPEAGMWAIADGMGGHQAGDVASRLVIETLRSITPPGSAAGLLESCENGIALANLKLNQMGRERGGAIIGATIALLLTFDRHYACVWAGDSRIYMVRQGKMIQLSNDHTEVGELLASNVISREEARTWTARNALTRAVGASDALELETITGSMFPGDVFVLCSDGLTQHVADEEILFQVENRHCQEACERLIGLTLERGATDNVTVIVVRFMSNSVTSDYMVADGGPA